VKKNGNKNKKEIGQYAKSKSRVIESELKHEINEE